MPTLVDQLAEDLARDTIKRVEATGDERLIDAVAKSLADTSTTFKDAFLTAVRYYQAEARARQLLPDMTAPKGLSLPPPEPAKPGAEAAPEPEPAQEDEPATEAAEDEIPYAEVELVEEDAAKLKTGNPGFNMQMKIPASPGSGETPSVEPEITEPRKKGR